MPKEPKTDFVPGPEKPPEKTRVGVKSPWDDIFAKVQEHGDWYAVAEYRTNGAAARQASYLRKKYGARFELVHRRTEKHLHATGTRGTDVMVFRVYARPMLQVAKPESKPQEPKPSL